MSSSQKSYAAAAASHISSPLTQSRPPLTAADQSIPISSAHHPTQPPLPHHLSPSTVPHIALRSPPVVENSTPQNMSEKVAPVPIPSLNKYSQSPTFASPAKHEYLQSLDPNLFDDNSHKTKLIFGGDAVPKSTAKAPLPNEAAAIMTSSTASTSALGNNNGCDDGSPMDPLFGTDANERKMEESNDLLALSTDDLRQLLEMERRKHEMKAVAYETLKRNYYIKTNEYQKKITKTNEKLKLLQKSTHSDAFDKLIKEKHELRRGLHQERAARMTDRQIIWKAFSENMDLWRRIHRAQMELTAWQKFYAESSAAYHESGHTTPNLGPQATPSQSPPDHEPEIQFQDIPRTPTKETPKEPRRVQSTPARASELKVPDLRHLTRDYSPSDLALIKKLIAENKTLCKNVNQLRYLLDDERKRRKRQEEIVQKTNLKAAEKAAAAVSAIGLGPDTTHTAKGDKENDKE